MKLPKIFKKKTYEERKAEGLLAHTHCLICSLPIEETESGYCPREYICSECMMTFPDSYILYRIECNDKGLWYPAFDRLEARLWLGAYNKDGSVRDNSPNYDEPHGWEDGEY